VPPPPPPPPADPAFITGINTGQNDVDSRWGEDDGRSSGVSEIIGDTSNAKVLDDMPVYKSPLRVRRSVYAEASKTTNVNGNVSGRVSIFWVWFTWVKSVMIGDASPILRGTLLKLNTTFGTGISSLYYDWRWICMLNLGGFLIWFVLCVYPWFHNPPRFMNSDPPYANFWNRDDMTTGALLTLLTGAKAIGDNSTLVQDSFMFYTGYTEKMGVEGHSLYEMGPAWVSATLLTCTFLFYNINQRLHQALAMVKHDPVVHRIVAASRDPTMGGRATAADHEVGQTCQEAILGGFDHSACSSNGMRGSIKALVTLMEATLAGAYREYVVPAHLTMGAHTFEAWVVPQGSSRKKQINRESHQVELLDSGPSLVDYRAQAMGDSSIPISGLCRDWKVYIRTGEEDDSLPSQVATKDQLLSAYKEYCFQNPDASGCSKSSSTETVLDCILRFGDYWDTPPGGAARHLWVQGKKKPSVGWIKAQEALKGDAKEQSKLKISAFVVATRHGDEVNTLDLCRQYTGMALTGILFFFSASGVYEVTNNHESINTKYGPYAVTVILVLIKSVIPAIVKQIVKLENWTSEEFIMQTTLIRVYVLKMANLAMLLFQLDQLGKKGQGQDCVALDVGLFLYQQVVAGHILSMIINFFCWGFFYRFLGPTGADPSEYDNQSVAQTYIELNYMTALVWVGTPYCPFLPLVASLLGFAEIRWSAFWLQWFCKTAEKPFRASADARIQVITIFLCTFAYACIPVCLFLYAHPSILYIHSPAVGTFPSYCGPIVATKRRYQVLRDFLLGWSPDVKYYASYAMNPMCMFMIIIFYLVYSGILASKQSSTQVECANQYLDRANSLMHLRERRLHLTRLGNENGKLETQIGELKSKISDLERGTHGELNAATPLRSSGRGDLPESRVSKGGSCW